ncbi:hypothetical protein [Acinetobacter sp. YH12096]|uniref:hypothetical protein n=1 Tax=Acinetobacter sp. YH12096 TaxID=2601085 RepID=UPI0015D2FE57|nr:hypothetical protein [Acinetobacter sp. YH12096]
MENFTLNRNFTLVPEHLNVNCLVQEIMNYRSKFLRLSKDFLHCKVEERFIDELNRSYHEHQHKLDRTYCYGKALSEELAFEVGNINNTEIYPTLKILIEKLVEELISRQRWQNIADEVKQYSESHNINIWSLTYMDTRYRQIYEYIDEILDQLEILKQSFTYQILSKQITTIEAIKLMNTPNISIQGNQNQIQTGSNNQQIVNQAQNTQPPEIFNELITFISKIENVSDDDKKQFQAQIDELKLNYNQPTFHHKYNNFMANVSAHVTIGTALWQSGLMPILTACLPT